MAVIFRVEDLTEWGMYSSDVYLSLLDQNSTDIRRPTVMNPWRPWGDATRFGFVTLGSMAEWIQEVRVLDLLIARGFRIGVYVVPEAADYTVDQKQARFRLDRALRRGHLHLDTIREAVRLEDSADA